jgi:hypothetical protein
MEPIEEGCPATQRGIHLGCGISGGCNQHSSTNMGFHDGCFFFTGFHDIFSTRFNEKNCGYHGILSGYPRNLPMDVAGKNGHLTITMVMGFLMIPDDS